MKRQLAFTFAAAALAVGAAYPGAASAQRVIEETLVLRDPTVAARDSWLIGAGLEYWKVSGDYTIVDTTGREIAKGSIDYNQPGYNFYVGYGDFTLFLTGRSGDGTLDVTYAPGALGPNQTLRTSSKVEQEDREIMLRWMFYKSRNFNPYALAGYSWTDYEETQTLTTPGFIWTATGTPTRTKKIEYTAPLLGLGAVIPFSESFGMRIDGRVKFYDAKRTGTGFTTVEDSGTGGDMTGTVYWNIFEGLNLQAGARFMRLDGGEQIGWVNRTGFFASLGYVLRF